MNRRISGIVLFGLAGLLSFYVFLGEHMADQAGKRILPAGAAGGTGFPFLSDRLYHARGKALFERGVNRLGEPALRDADFRAAYRSYLKSLALNPFSATAHFDFGQALQYLNALDIPSAERYADEYRKAADLSGVDTSIYREVGRVLVSRWSGLTPADRVFAQEIVRSLLSFRGPDQESRLDAYLNLWNLNIRDAAVLEKTLPPDAGILRRAAQFLGERGLFKETRLVCLAKAEVLDFSRAAEEARAGQSGFNALRTAEALDHFRAAARLLGGIRFTQELLPRDGVLGPEKFADLRKTVRLGILKARMDTAAEPKDYFEDFRAYLEVEDSVAAIKEIETLLKSRGAVDDRPSAGFVDFTSLNIKLLLDFKQSRFRDVVQMGEALSRNVLIIPDEQRRAYGAMFEIIGDASQRLDNLYESNGYYERALDLGAEGAVVRIKMRRNFERLNETASIRDLQEEIDAEIAPRETILTDAVWKSGEAYSPSLVLDEKIYRLGITFSDTAAGPPLLVSIVFNGRLIWEDFIKSESFEVSLPAVLGRNTLEVTPINRDCRPVRLTLVPEAEKGLEEAPLPASSAKTGRRGRD
jgi:tetratricopeptide (TPR) repeat protein